MGQKSQGRRDEKMKKRDRNHYLAIVMNPKKTEQPEFQIITAGDPGMAFEIELDAIMGADRDGEKKD
jgi:hypothetical protein